MRPIIERPGRLQLSSPTPERKPPGRCSREDSSPAVEKLMPPRNPELPEGTDHIVNGAAGSSGSSANASSDGRSSAAGGSPSTGNDDSKGFVASASREDGGATDKLVHQVRDQVSSLRGQATDRLKGFADEGKGKAAGLLDELSGVIDDAARSIDERLGDDYGRYAHQAADAVSDFTNRIRGKTVDDLIEDGRSMVRASPGVAIAVAAIAGFAMMRVIKTGLDEVGLSSGRSDGSGGKSEGRNRTGSSDTTAAGGA